jgi:hypothetical protein
MILYAATLFVALNQAVGFIVGILFGRTQYITVGLVAAAVIAVPVISYFLGVWIGIRCNQFALFAVIAAVLLGRLIGTSIDFLVLQGAAFEAVLGAPKSFGLFLASLGSGVILTVPAGIIGWWRGRRIRRPAYLHFLLSRLNAGDQQALVDMAYDETRRKVVT